MVDLKGPHDLVVKNGFLKSSRGVNLAEAYFAAVLEDAFDIVAESPDAAQLVLLENEIPDVKQRFGHLGMGQA